MSQLLIHSLAFCRKCNIQIVSNTNTLIDAKCFQCGGVLTSGSITMTEFRCFKCGDGHTPLYCLSCAPSELQATIDRITMDASALTALRIEDKRTIETIKQDRDNAIREMDKTHLENNKLRRALKEIRDKADPYTNQL